MPHLSITDAMGHGVVAALNATLRGQPAHWRRSALLLEQANTANRALAEHAVAAGLDDFVTGQISRLDLRTGSLGLVNAGHVPPYLARGSNVIVVALPVELPLGLFPDTSYRGTSSLWKRGPVVRDRRHAERHAAGLDLPQEIETRCLPARRFEHWPTASSTRPGES
jgi:serine phosphatase RsbU (regulator of sigma subunit)